MVITELEQFLSDLGLEIEQAMVGDQTYLVVRKVPIPAGVVEESFCDVAVLRTTDDPWVPASAIQVSPHLTPIGQNSSQESPLGPEWQYLSRRFDHVPTPQSFYAHIRTVIGEL